jgi:hypothetical protein
MLASHREEVLASRRQQFDQFLAAQPGGRQAISERDRNQLFEDFLKWSAREGR